MSIFRWGKRSGGGGDEGKGREEGEREVKVLGSGCTRCIEQERNVRAALGELGVDTQVEHVTDPTRIAAYGVMSTPALVVRGRVVAYGRVLTKEEALKILKESLENPL